MVDGEIAIIGPVCPSKRIRSPNGSVPLLVCIPIAKRLRGRLLRFRDLTTRENRSCHCDNGSENRDYYLHDVSLRLSRSLEITPNCISSLTQAYRIASLRTFRLSTQRPYWHR